MPETTITDIAFHVDESEDEKTGERLVTLTIDATVNGELEHRIVVGPLAAHKVFCLLGLIGVVADPDDAVHDIVGEVHEDI